MASKLVPGMTSTRDYLNRIPRQVNSLVLKECTPLEIDKLIRTLPNKSSYRHGRVSNVMLKSLRSSITFPLCHIFNYSLEEGVSQELIKWAEVILLCKGKDMDIMVNYRPISLLLTMSKLLEKVVYHHLYSFLEKNGTLLKSVQFQEK